MPVDASPQTILQALQYGHQAATAPTPLDQIWKREMLLREQARKEAESNQTGQYQRGLTAKQEYDIQAAQEQAQRMAEAYKMAGPPPSDPANTQEQIKWRTKLSNSMYAVGIDPTSIQKAQLTQAGTELYRADPNQLNLEAGLKGSQIQQNLASAASSTANAQFLGSLEGRAPIPPSPVDLSQAKAYVDKVNQELTDKNKPWYNPFWSALSTEQKDMYTRELAKEHSDIWRKVNESGQFQHIPDSQMWDQAMQNLTQRHPELVGGQPIQQAPTVAGQPQVNAAPQLPATNPMIRPIQRK